MARAVVGKIIQKLDYGIFYMVSTNYGERRVIAILKCFFHKRALNSWKSHYNNIIKPKTLTFVN